MRLILISFIWLALLISPVSAEPSANFEIIGKFDQAPGNLAITPDGRVIMSLHQFYEPRYSVVEVLANNSIVPFPNLELNERAGKTSLRLDSVLGIRADTEGIVWMLDNGLRSAVTPKIVGWDTQSDKLHRVIYFPDSVAPKDAFVNDLVVDRTHNRIFISDPAGGSNAALIVVNLQTGLAERVLEGDRSVLPEDVDLIVGERPLRVKDQSGKLVRPHIGVNPITEDLKNEWVYYGAMHGRSLYRIRAAALADDRLNREILSRRVERYSDKPISDGITIDKAGNIYLGELADNAIGTITPKRTYKRLAQSPQLSWVDSLCFGPKGQLHAVVNQLHLSAQLNGGEALSKPPYYLIRMKPVALD